MSIEGNGAEAPSEAQTEAVQTEAVQTEAVETETQETTASESASPTKDDFAKKFAALSRKEKEIRSREQEYEARLAELNAKTESMLPKEEQTKEELPLEYRLKRNPLKTLEELGLSYDQLTNLVLNDGKLPPEMQMKLMKEELESDYKTKFEQLEEKLKAKEIEEQEAQLNSVVTNFKKEINDLVTSDTEKYELINASESQELVFDIISQHYEETNKILSIEEAAQAVEEHLLEEFSKFSNIKKLSSGEKAQEPDVNFRQSPTLSNDLSAQSVNSTDKKLSPEESKARAAAMLKWVE